MSISVSNTVHFQEGSKKGRMGEKTFRRRKCTKLERNKRKRSGRKKEEKMKT